MFSDTIKKDALKPGDVVGIRQPTQINFRFFRYKKTIPMTIERITPARTKFVMTNGCEFSKKETFYPITAESSNQTHVALCAEKISRYLSKLDTLHRNGDLYKIDDKSIVTVSELLEKIYEEVK